MKNLEQAVKFFIYSKYCLEIQLDCLSNSDWLTYKLSHITGIIKPPEGFLKSYKIAINPSTFVKLSLPFSDSQFVYDKSSQMDINPFLVLGGTYNKNYSTNSEKILKDFNQLNKLEKENPEAAKYTKIGSLPLFVASFEGKNRVLGYQNLNKQISAYVTQTEYPNPEDLKIHNVPIFNLFVLSRKNGVKCRYEVLPFHEFTLPLLRAYGVKHGNRIHFNKAIYFLKQWRDKRKKISMFLMQS